MLWQPVDKFHNSIFLLQVQAIQDGFQGFLGYAVVGENLVIPAAWATPLWVVGIQVLAAYVCFAACKTACKILIQNFSFTFALSLVGPVTVNLLIVLCGMRNADPCAFYRTIPDYLFFEIPPGKLSSSNTFLNN